MCAGGLTVKLINSVPGYLASMVCQLPGLRMGRRIFEKTFLKNVKNCEKSVDIIKDEWYYLIAVAESGRKTKNKIKKLLTNSK